MFKRHPIWAFIATALLIAALLAVVIIPLLRFREISQIDELVERSRQTLVDSLGNQAIFTGQPAEMTEKLDVAAAGLSQIHDHVVLAEIHFAKSHQRAALEYTDFLARFGLKLAQVATAKAAADTAVGDYDRSINILKLSNIATRAQAQEDASHKLISARDSTELAFQECVLLTNLSHQYGYAQRQASRILSSVGGADVESAIGSLQPALENATTKAHNLRKIFNPTARPPD